MLAVLDDLGIEVYSADNIKRYLRAPSIVLNHEKRSSKEPTLVQFPNSRYLAQKIFITRAAYGGSES